MIMRTLFGFDEMEKYDMTIWKVLAVGAGGFIGAACRYLFTLLPLPETAGFPLATFLINLIGSFVIGAVAEFSENSGLADENMILFLKTGVCGGFTTFSTFALEGAGPLSEGKKITAGIYALCSVALCFAGVMCGRAAVRRFFIR